MNKDINKEIEKILEEYEVMGVLTVAGIEQTYKGGVKKKLIKQLSNLLTKQVEEAVRKYGFYVGSMYGVPVDIERYLSNLRKEQDHAE